MTARGLSWQDHGLCQYTDPEVFFPEKGGSIRDAYRICGRCPVQQECLEYALDNDGCLGVWGGVSERALRAMRAERRAAA